MKPPGQAGDPNPNEATVRRVSPPMPDLVSRAAADDLLARAWAAAGEDPALALDLARQAESLTGGFQAGRADALTVQAGVLVRLSRFEDAVKAATRAARAAAAAGAGATHLQALDHAAAAEYYLGNLEEAVRRFEEMLALRATLGLEPVDAATLNRVGVLHLELGNTTRAVDWLRESQRLASAVGDAR
ncbi:MAG TPA: tetratricopeptide repeat protein, partial [Deinococcales bacterium]|nr:tetratricopeptide repeat protein [Deinococcales bacterium]